MATIYGGGASFFRASACAVAPLAAARLPKNARPQHMPPHIPLPPQTTPTTDEVNACVLDVGTHSVKAGYAGDDTPKAVFPSACGVVDKEGEAGSAGTGAVKKGGAAAAAASDKEGDQANGAAADKAKQKQRDVYVGADGPSFRRPGMEVVSPFDADGQPSDWDLCERLWRHALADRLRVTDPADMALLVVEPTHASRGSRERCVERLFEGLGCPAAYLAKAALLASFATARQTSVVVDAGHMATTGEYCFLLVFVFEGARAFAFFFSLGRVCPRAPPVPPTPHTPMPRALSSLAPLLSLAASSSGVDDLWTDCGSFTGSHTHACELSTKKSERTKEGAPTVASPHFLLPPRLSRPLRSAASRWPA